jgi:uncharacterized protein (TIGR00252 family)
MSTATGNRAETVAVEYLKNLKFKILERNWKTRWCEIDIIALRSKTVYFIEVKYRSSSHFGSAIEYITPTKLKQMRFAAEYWLALHAASDARLGGVAVSGPDYKIEDFVLIDD